MKRAISLILALVLILALAPAASAANSPAYGSEVWLQDTTLQDGVILSDNIFWSDSYSKPRHEYYVTYSPSGSLPDSSTVPTPTQTLPLPQLPHRMKKSLTGCAAATSLPPTAPTPASAPWPPSAPPCATA